MRLNRKATPATIDEPSTAPSTMGFGAKFNTPYPSNESMRITSHIKTIVGPKITLKGELSGDEDIRIEGHFEGKVTLNNHHLTIGTQGDIKGDIFGQSVTVGGKLVGDVKASQLITAKSTSEINGNLKGARVHLEDGAKFHGGIDMDASLV